MNSKVLASLSAIIRYQYLYILLLLGNYPVTRQTCGVSTYTVFAVNHVSSATYSSATPTTNTGCQSMCTADPFCHGFAFNSITRECKLSDSTIPKHVACAECSFSARDCVGKDTNTSCNLSVFLRKKHNVDCRVFLFC